MKTILNNSESELMINKSRFIGYLYKVNNQEEIDIILKEIRTKYHDATHICYAYSLLNNKKANDDGEPPGTAGLPILEVLNKHDLVNVLGIVIRYFGGIKLGSGGLIRAYSNTIRNTLEHNEIKDLRKGYLIRIIFDYSLNKVINNIKTNYEIVEKEFKEQIIYLIKADDSLLNELKDINQTYEIINETYL